MLHYRPQFIFLAWYAYEFAVSIVNAGKPKPDYNVFKTIGWIAVSVTLLAFGGFFNTIRVAQMIYIFLSAGGLFLSFFKHGESRENYSAGAGLKDCLMGLVLVGWGGYFHGFGIH